MIQQGKRCARRAGIRSGMNDEVPGHWYCRDRVAGVAVRPAVMIVG